MGQLGRAMSMIEVTMSITTRASSGRHSRLVSSARLRRLITRLCSRIPTRRRSSCPQSAQSRRSLQQKSEANRTLADSVS